ncbi:MAG: GNAT family N-acetyltransferase [Aestuariivirgaceae bacterium]
MADCGPTLAFEQNLAEWWEAHVVAGGGTADRKRGLCWSLDRAGGGSGIHRVRLSEADFDVVINRCLNEACSCGSAIWAYVTNHASPKDAVARFKAAGFHHTKRFDVFVHDLRSLPAVELSGDVTIERLTDLNRFSKSVAHPYHGPVTTKLRRAAVASADVLVRTRPQDYCAYVLSVAGTPASAVTVLRTGDMAGVYDVGTIESQRGRGYARQLLAHALHEAGASGASHAGLIAVAKAERLYGRVGFYTTGDWMSFLYFSKTRMQQRARIA